jgi:hypothetical protein
VDLLGARRSEFDAGREERDALLGVRLDIGALGGLFASDDGLEERVGEAVDRELV